MIRYSQLSVGEKLKQVRVAKGLSQENVADAVGSSTSSISRIEQDQTECTDEMLDDIKAFLGIAGAPLFEHELRAYEDQLWVLNDLANSNRTTDARARQQNMFPIETLPYEQDLCLLHSMIDARLLFQEENIAAGVDRLDMAEAHLEEACVEVKHLYHRNRGFVVNTKGGTRASLNEFLRAFDLQSDKLKADASFMYNIGSQYMLLGQIFHAIRYLELAERSLKGDRTNSRLMNAINSGLLYSYIQTREYSRALKKADEVIISAKSAFDEAAAIVALGNIGTIKYHMGNTEEAITYYDKYLKWHTDRIDAGIGITHHVMMLTSKAIALSTLKKHSQAKEAFKQALALVEGDEHGTIVVEASRHSVAVSVKESSDYLENTAIPYLRALGTEYNFLVLDLCDKLETNYKKRGLNKKAAAVIEISRDIYNEIMFGKEDA